MKNGFPLTLLFAPLAAALFLAGCASSPPARFYTLTPLVPAEEKHAAPAANPVSVSIAPVEVPEYLDRPQIVTRDGPNELRLAEFDRWAGSLGDNIGTTLAEDLALLLGSDRIYVYPRPLAVKADYAVNMRVLRLDCVPGDRVLLKAQWTLSAGAERKVVATRVTTSTERLTDARYETMVAAVSRAVEQVSREIAREIPNK